MSEQKKISYQDWYQTLRNQIILSYDNAKELALKNFDEVSRKLNEQLMINDALKATKEPNPLQPNTSELPKKKK